MKKKLIIFVKKSLRYKDREILGVEQVQRKKLKRTSIR